MASFEVLQESVSDYLFEKAESEFVVAEGATTEINREYKKYLQETKGLVKQIKSNIKDKKWDDARKACDEYEKAIKDAIDNIDEIPETVGSAIAGTFVQELATYAKAVLLAIPTLGIGSLVVTVKDRVEEIVGVVKEIKDMSKGDKEISIGVLNERRDKVVGILTFAKQQAAAFKKEIDRLEKEENGEVKKESVEETDPIEMKLQIFESCAAGEITEEERNELLEMIK